MATAKPFITPMVFVLQYVETHGRASQHAKNREKEISLKISQKQLLK